jgi:hypothetical protein
VVVLLTALRDHAGWMSVGRDDVNGPARRFYAPVRALALGLLLGACGTTRYEAADDLLQLEEAMHRHRTQYGAFPQTLDAARPESLTNLPFSPRHDSTLRLVASDSKGYMATVRVGVWICGMTVTESQTTPPDCVATGSAAEAANAAVREQQVVDDLFESSDTTRADSTASASSPN